MLSPAVSVTGGQSDLKAAAAATAAATAAALTATVLPAVPPAAAAVAAAAAAATITHGNPLLPHRNNNNNNNNNNNSNNTGRARFNPSPQIAIPLTPSPPMPPSYTTTTAATTSTTTSMAAAAAAAVAGVPGRPPLPPLSPLPSFASLFARPGSTPSPAPVSWATRAPSYHPAHPIHPDPHFLAPIAPSRTFSSSSFSSSFLSASPTPPPSSFAPFDAPSPAIPVSFHPEDPIDLQDLLNVNPSAFTTLPAARSAITRLQEQLAEAIRARDEAVSLHKFAVDDLRRVDLVAAEIVTEKNRLAERCGDVASLRREVEVLMRERDVANREAVMLREQVEALARRKTREAENPGVERGATADPVAASADAVDAGSNPNAADVPMVDAPQQPVKPGTPVEDSTRLDTSSSHRGSVAPQMEVDDQPAAALQSSSSTDSIVSGPQAPVAGSEPPAVSSSSSSHASATPGVEVPPADNAPEDLAAAIELNLKSWPKIIYEQELGRSTGLTGKQTKQMELFVYEFNRTRLGDAVAERCKVTTSRKGFRMAVPHFLEDEFVRLLEDEIDTGRLFSTAKRTRRAPQRKDPTPGIGGAAPSSAAAAVPPPAPPKARQPSKLAKGVVFDESSESSSQADKSSDEDYVPVKEERGTKRKARDEESANLSEAPLAVGTAQTSTVPSPSLDKAALSPHVNPRKRVSTTGSEKSRGPSAEKDSASGTAPPTSLPSPRPSRNLKDFTPKPSHSLLKWRSPQRAKPAGSAASASTAGLAILPTGTLLGRGNPSYVCQACHQRRRQEKDSATRPAASGGFANAAASNVTEGILPHGEASSAATSERASLATTPSESGGPSYYHPACGLMEPYQLVLSNHFPQWRQLGTTEKESLKQTIVDWLRQELSPEAFKHAFVSDVRGDKPHRTRGIPVARVGDLVTSIRAKVGLLFSAAGIVAGS
ncbi:hypothetical protein DFJ73DRAFT_801975 [Zopfochytrium polystomum]|nr:hypothetical protein DFJ73DRAFT_801975 [Zopfochytrium polystomum]